MNKFFDTLAEEAGITQPTIYPVYVLSILDKDRKIQDTTKECLSYLSKLGKLCHIVTQDRMAPFYEQEYPECTVISYNYFTDYRYSKLPHKIPHIRNFILDYHADHFKHVDCLYMFDDDIIPRVSSFGKGEGETNISCTKDGVRKFFGIWQTIYKFAQDDHPDLKIAMCGMIPYQNANAIKQYESNKLSDGYYVIDDTRLCQAILINAKLLRENNIRYFMDYPTWEDFDLLIQVAQAGLTSIGIRWPIHYHENRPMLSSKSVCDYSQTGRLTHRSANLYRKWGKDICIGFRPVMGLPNEINIKLGSFMKWKEMGCPISYDYNVLRDLDVLESGGISGISFLMDLPDNSYWTDAEKEFVKQFEGRPIYCAANA